MMTLDLFRLTLKVCRAMLHLPCQLFYLLGLGLYFLGLMLGRT
ncbi:MAG: hypothetical protein ACLQHF_01365 [Terracidiphilus sp.]